LANNLLREAKISIINVIELVNRLDVIKCYTYLGIVNAYSGQAVKANYYLSYVKKYLDEHGRSNDTILIESLYDVGICYLRPDFDMIAFYVASSAATVGLYLPFQFLDLQSFDVFCVNHFKIIDENCFIELDRAFKKQSLFLCKLGAQLQYLRNMLVETSDISLALANNIYSIISNYPYPIVGYMSHIMKAVAQVHLGALLKMKPWLPVQDNNSFLHILSMLKDDVRLMKKADPSLSIHGTFILQLEEVIQSYDQPLLKLQFI
jgi:hypothetical protein